MFAHRRYTLFVSCIALLGLACSDSEDSSSTPPDDSAVCASALFCDNFETATAGSAPAGAWTAIENNGTVSVDTTRAFRGTQAVKASTLSTAESGSTYKAAFLGLSGAPVVPVPNDTFYGRMMIYIESVPTTNVHWTIVDGTGPVPGQTYTSTYRYGGQMPITDGSGAPGSQLMANYDTTDFYQTPPNGPQTDCWQHSQGKAAPVGKWTCAEWYFNGPDAQMRFWLDGTELTDLAVNESGQGCVAPELPPNYRWEAPNFSRLDMGWESYQEDDARSVWIDDVVISSTQVGCPGAPN